MHDIVDLIKNIQTLSENNSAFTVLKDFERVLDELDVYVFKNWEEGELLSGPNVNRYNVKCSFMWPVNEMPDPQAGKILNEYGCNVVYKKEHILIPRKINDPSDFRPGTKKGKIDAHPIWVVEVTMPKKLMQDVSIGRENKINNQMAELMHYSERNITDPSEIAQEVPNEEEPTA